RDKLVTGVQTCALPILQGDRYSGEWARERFREHGVVYELAAIHLNVLVNKRICVWPKGRTKIWFRITAANGTSGNSNSGIPQDRSEERRVGKECRCR